MAAKDCRVRGGGCFGGINAGKGFVFFLLSDRWNPKHVWTLGWKEPYRAGQNLRLVLRHRRCTGRGRGVRNGKGEKEETEREKISRSRSEIKPLLLFLLLLLLLLLRES